MLIMVLVVSCNTVSVSAQESLFQHKLSAELRQRRLLDGLHRYVPTIKFDGQPFEVVLAWFKQQGIKNIVVNWQELAECGQVDCRTPVSLRLADVYLVEVLEQVLVQLSEESSRECWLNYHVQDDQIIISTRQEFGDQLVFHTYPIDRFLHMLIDASEVQVVNVVGGQDGGYVDSCEERVDYEAARDEALAKVLEYIQAIKPGSWKQNGGRGTIRVVQGKLLITHTIEVHEMIGGTVPRGAGY